MKSILYTIIAVVSFCLLVNESEYVIWNLIGLISLVILLLKFNVFEEKTVGNLAICTSADEEEEKDFFEMSTCDQSERQINRFWMWFVGMVSGILIVLIIEAILLYGSGML